MKMFSDLPRDLVMNILSRIPLRSMREVRVTCKTLYTLSQSEIFAKMHLAKEDEREEGESQVMILDDKLSLMSVTIGCDEDLCVEVKVKRSPLLKQVKVSKVFHCEGLLLCILKDDDTRIVVWNPYWGQTRWIEPRYTHVDTFGFYRSYYRYALGYAANENTSQRNHKLLRFMDDKFRRERFTWYEIYDFESDQWTTLDVSPEWYIAFYQHGVSLKGNTYFCATKVKIEEEDEDDSSSGGEDDEERDGHLICFDYTRECFGPLMPMPFDARYHDYVTVSSVREEKLAVLFTHNQINQYDVDLWITTKIEPGKVSWSKFLALHIEPEDPSLSLGFFIDEEKKVAIGLDRVVSRSTLGIIGEAGYLRELVLEEVVDTSYMCSAQMCSYVPSLVQIKQPVKVERRPQCSLEQGRFDEKMSRLVQLEKSKMPPPNVTFM